MRSTPRGQEVADAHMRSGKTLIQSGKRKPQSLREGHVPSVVTCQVIAQLPDTICKWLEGKQHDVELHEIVSRAVRFWRSNELCALQPAKYVRRFGPYQ